jgi:hypothetical protein
LADLAVGIGLIVGSRWVTAIGLVLLGWGVPMWLVGLATGGEFYPTSILTHLGGAAIGIAGLRHLGGLRDDWWRAYLFVAGLLVASRLATPAAMNINFAYRPWPLLAGWIPNLPAHIAALLLIWGTGLYLAERILQFLLRFRPAASS